MDYISEASKFMYDESQEPVMFNFREITAKLNSKPKTEKSIIQFLKDHKIGADLVKRTLTFYKLDHDKYIDRNGNWIK